MRRRHLHAQCQALGTLAALLGARRPSLSSEGRAPKVEHGELAGRPATFITPSSAPPWPTFLFANGATPAGRAHSVPLRLGEALAHAGFALCIPDLQGVAGGELTPATLKTAVDCTTVLADRPCTFRGRIGLVGVSVGGTLALLVAADQALARRISVVVCVAPFSDLRQVMRLATTGTYAGERGSEPYPVPSSLSTGLAASLLALPGASAPPDPAAAAIEALLANRAPEHFDPLFAHLPRDVREAAAALSPVHSIGQVLAPVEIATAPRDRYFPVAESRALAALNPNVRVTVSSALAHAIPRLDGASLAGLYRFHQFLGRSLRAAGSDTDPRSPTRKEHVS